LCGLWRCQPCAGAPTRFRTPWDCGEGKARLGDQSIILHIVLSPPLGILQPIPSQELLTPDTSAEPADLAGGTLGLHSFAFHPIACSPRLLSFFLGGGKNRGFLSFFLLNRERVSECEGASGCNQSQPKMHSDCLIYI
jgi:hypothetical protein